MMTSPLSQIPFLPPPSAPRSHRDLAFEASPDGEQTLTLTQITLINFHIRYMHDVYHSMHNYIKVYNGYNFVFIYEIYL